MNLNEQTINRLLLMLCAYKKYTLTMIKGHNKENDYIYTKYILYLNGVEDYYTYSKRSIIVYMSDELDSYGKEPRA